MKIISFLISDEAHKRMKDMLDELLRHTDVQDTASPTWEALEALRDLSNGEYIGAEWNPVDTFIKEQMKTWVTESYGERCEYHDVNCHCCQAWDAFDTLFYLIDWDGESKVQHGTESKPETE